MDCEYEERKHRCDASPQKDNEKQISKRCSLAKCSGRFRNRKKEKPDKDRKIEAEATATNRDWRSKQGRGNNANDSKRDNQIITLFSFWRFIRRVRLRHTIK